LLGLSDVFSGIMLRRERQPDWEFYSRQRGSSSEHVEGGSGSWTN
jgi:hypothetical protein